MKNNKWLIVGLGNSDSQYEKNRHNVGFWYIDYAINQREVTHIKNKYCALYQYDSDHDTIFFAKPHFYMNESGVPIKKLLENLEIQISQLIVFVDDMNLDVGDMRIRKKGQDGGHNGLKSIEHHLKTQEYPRLRIGIGSPENKKDHINYVLGDFTEEERSKIHKVLERADESVKEILSNGFGSSMSKFN